MRESLATLCEMCYIGLAPLLCRQALVDVVSGCMLANVQYRLSLLGQLLLCDVRF